MTEPSSLPRLLAIAQVADLLQVSAKTVRRWIDAGNLPIHRLGRQIRISASDLEDFLKSRRSF